MNIQKQTLALAMIRAVQTITPISAKIIFLPISDLTNSSGTHIISLLPHIVLNPSPELKLAFFTRVSSVALAGKYCSGSFKFLNLNPICETYSQTKIKV